MKKVHLVLSVVFFALGAAAACFTGSAQAIMILGASLNALGQGLRSLSLSGSAGNALAWALLAVLGLLPLFGLLPAKRARGKEDVLWGIAAAYALFMLYALVNPGLLRGVVYPAWAALEPELLAVTLFIPLAALLLAALFLRLANANEKGSLLFKRFRLLLTLEQLVAAFAAGLRIPPLFSMTGFDLAYGIVDALGVLVEVSLLVAVCETGKALLAGLSRGWLNDENAPLADRLALWARRMLAGDIAVMLIRCFGTLALGAHLTNMNMTVDFSIADLVISLSALLLSRFVRAGICVRAENDLYI